MIRRARLITVLGAVLAGALTVIGSTQTWLSVVLADGATEPLEVPGADALPVLAPLGLAALALGGALSIVGRVLRYVFGAVGLVIAVTLGIASARIAFGAPLDAVAGTVATATGIQGADALADLVASVTPTAWPAVTLVVQIVLAAASVFALVTAHAWQSGSERRYQTGAGGAPSRPHDAIDSWDDLSRGDDPTTRPDHG